MTDYSDLIARLHAQAQASSQAHRMMAEAKSLRQGDCDPPRADLYSWPTPEQTLQDEAATALEALSARVTELEQRLEVVPGWSQDADGIACRDDTIKLLDAKVEALSARERVLREALVTAVIPLEAMNLAGMVHSSPELQQGVLEGIAAVRSALTNQDGGEKL